MSHLNPIDVASRYFLSDRPEASGPSTRLSNILDRIRLDQPLSQIAETFLQKQGFIALLQLAQKEVNYEAFCEIARIEQAKRKSAIQSERQIKEAMARAREKAWAAEYLLQCQQAEEARIARESDPAYINKLRNQQLRDRYGLGDFIEPDCFHRLMEILRHVDVGNRFTDDDTLWLRTIGKRYFSGMLFAVFHEREADFYVTEYKRTNDPWMAVNASGHYRKCNKANQAHELLKSTAMERQRSPKLKSALLTTHGGVLRDLGRRDDALNFGIQAHTLTPRDFRPCTLLGALNMEMGNYDGAKEWYAKAMERGASEQSIDYDLRGIFLRSDKAKREEIKTFLLREDPVRYSWVRQ